MERRHVSYHPACLLFPQLGPEELQELADDIKAHGLRNPIVLYQGKVLDGRNRLAACKIAGVKPRFVQWKGSGSPTEWVISENLIRRHLTSSQRAVVAYDLLPLLEKEAKARQRLSQGRGRKKVSQKLDTSSQNGAATKVAARIAKTNHTYVQTLKSIGSEASELLDAIRQGKLTVPDAKRLMAIPRMKRTRVLGLLDGESRAKKIPILISKVEHQLRAAAIKRFRANGDSLDSIRICKCRFQDLDVTHGTASLVLTDIPYDSGFLPQVEELASLVNQWLRPKGVFAMVCGQYYLPQVIAATSKHLTWRWQGTLIWQGDSNLIYPLGITSQSKPILIFSRGEWQKHGRWSDVFYAGAKEKACYDHQLSLEPVEKLIQYLSEPGDLVIDPCGGSFTTAIGCYRLGRRFVGCDIKADCISIGRKRLTEEIHTVV